MNPPGGTRIHRLPADDQSRKVRRRGVAWLAIDHLFEFKQLYVFLKASQLADIKKVLLVWEEHRPIARDARRCKPLSS